MITLSSSLESVYDRHIHGQRLIWNSFELFYDKQWRRNMDSARYGALWNQTTTRNRIDIWTMNMSCSCLDSVYDKQ